MTRMPTNLKGFVRAYIERGFAVLPLHTTIGKGEHTSCSCGLLDCRNSAKHPIANLVPSGLKAASSDPAVVKGWFSGFTQSNVGIATGAISGIIVLDIDPRHGGDKSLRKLEAKHGDIPATLRWKTGGGGEHILFRYPGELIRNSVGILGEGIDVRGDGGYIVAPPSRHKSGNFYVLPEDMSIDTPLALPPPWLLRLLRQSGRPQSKCGTSPISQVVGKRVPEGQRNTTIARISGHLLAKRVDPHICHELMLAFNAKYCAPPLDEQEVGRTVASIDRLAFKQLMNKKLGAKK